MSASWPIGRTISGESSNETHTRSPVCLYRNDRLTCRRQEFGGAWTPEPGDVIEFDVLRKGKPFGSHSVTFGEDSNGRLTARTDVLLKAGLGPITVFKYELDATEVWQNGQLVSLNGEVNDDGKEGQGNSDAGRQ